MFCASGDNHVSSSLKCAIQSSTVEIGAVAFSGGGVRAPLTLNVPDFTARESAGVAEWERMGDKAGKEAEAMVAMLEQALRKGREKGCRRTAGGGGA